MRRSWISTATYSASIQSRAAWILTKQTAAAEQSFCGGRFRLVPMASTLHHFLGRAISLPLYIDAALGACCALAIKVVDALGLGAYRRRDEAFADCKELLPYHICLVAGECIVRIGDIERCCFIYELPVIIFITDHAILDGFLYLIHYNV